MASPETRNPKLDTLAIAQRLRTETRAEHERVEAIVDLLRPDLTLERYRQWLAAFAGFVAPMEERLEPTLRGLVPDWDRRRKAERLERDLVATSHPSGGSGSPRCGALPALDNPSLALGATYVLEGSTLGGQVIAEHVERVLGLGPDTGCSYFRGYGAETAAMWRSFREVLAAHGGEGRPAEDAMVAGACETFRLLGDWLARTVQTQR